MAYGSIDGVFGRYRPIGTVVGSADKQVRSLEVTSIFLNDASALIDAYLARRYSVPVPENAMITQIACDLALFNIMVEKLPKVPDFMQGRYDRCMKLLEQLAEGEIILPGSFTLVASGDSFAWSTTQGYHPTFSPVIHEANQTPDQDRVETEFNERASELGLNEIV
jgi:phage gp36-like protein